MFTRRKRELKKFNLTDYVDCDGMRAMLSINFALHQLDEKYKLENIFVRDVDGDVCDVGLSVVQKNGEFNLCVADLCVTQIKYDEKPTLDFGECFAVRVTYPNPPDGMARPPRFHFIKDPSDIEPMIKVGISNICDYLTAI